MSKDRLLFAKEGRAKYISHLDLMRTFQRAFLRADIPIKHTEGFNPHPFISIALPLSLGYASRCEILEFGLLPGVDHRQVVPRLNRALPEGVEVLECYPGQRPIKELAYLDYQILMDWKGDVFRLQRAWEGYLGRESWIIEKHTKKTQSGVTKVDVAPLIKAYNFTVVKERGLELRTVLSAQNPGLNPNIMVKAFTGENPDLEPDFVRYCRMEALDRDGKPFR